MGQENFESTASTRVFILKTITGCLPKTAPPPRGSKKGNPKVLTALPYFSPARSLSISHATLSDYNPVAIRKIKFCRRSSPPNYPPFFPVHFGSTL